MKHLQSILCSTAAVAMLSLTIGCNPPPATNVDVSTSTGGGAPVTNSNVTDAAETPSSNVTTGTETPVTETPE